MSDVSGPSGQTLGVRVGTIAARDIGAIGTLAMDAPLAHPAELSIARIDESALVLGAFQRRLAEGDAHTYARRISGGPIVEVGKQTIHVLLALAHPAVLVPSDALRVINRYVRPLLSALTKLGQKANYFGRDWVSVTKRPVAWTGFAHDAETGRAIFEAFIAVSTPFATGHRKERNSFSGREPVSLDEALGRHVDTDALMETIATAYVETYATARVALAPWALEEPAHGGASDIPIDPPWTATAQEAIGQIGAGPDARGIFRLGGDFLASRNAVARLERDLSELHGNARAVDVHTVQERVEAAFMAHDVALEGIRSLVSLTDVIVRARETLERGAPA